jgi:antitoxin YefM
MRVINYSDFRKNLSESLNAVNDNKEIVVVSRTKGKNVVVMDLEEYNSIQETMHLSSTPANRKRLQSALAEMGNKKYSKHKLMDG